VPTALLILSRDRHHAYAHRPECALAAADARDSQFPPAAVDGCQRIELAQVPTRLIGLTVGRREFELSVRVAGSGG